MMANRVLPLLCAALVSGQLGLVALAQADTTSVVSDVDLTTATEVTTEVNTTPVVVDTGNEGPVATPLSPAQTPMAMPQQSVPALTTAVPIETQEEAARPEEYWTLSAAGTKLESYSKRKYKAVAITLTNATPVHVELMSGEVINALNEQQLASEKAQKKGFGRSMRGLGLGLAGAATSFVPGVGGYAAHRSVSAASSVNNQVNRFNDSNVMPTGQYTQRLGQMVLQPNQSVTFNVVLPKGQTPNMRMVFKNLETNQILDLNQPIQ